MNRSKQKLNIALHSQRSNPSPQAIQSRPMINSTRRPDPLKSPHGNHAANVYFNNSPNPNHNHYQIMKPSKPEPNQLKKMERVVRSDSKDRYMQKGHLQQNVYQINQPNHLHKPQVQTNHHTIQGEPRLYKKFIAPAQN